MLVFNNCHFLVECFYLRHIRKNTNFIDQDFFTCVFVYSTGQIRVNIPCVSTRSRQRRAAAAAHPLEFEVSRYRTSQFARSFLPAPVRMWNDLPYTVFDTGTLYGFKGAVNRWLLP